MADQALPTLTPQQQQAVAAFKAKHPQFSGASVSDVKRSIKADPSAIGDYAILNGQLGMGKGDQYAGLAFDPATGQFRKDAPLSDFLIKGGLIVAGTAIGGTLLGQLGSSTTPFVGPVQEAAKGGGMSLWSKLLDVVLPTAVSSATNLIGTKMQVNANEEAAKIQAASAKEALDWQKDVFAQRQGQMSPYINTGNAANSRIADMMGLKQTDDSWSGMAPQQMPAGQTQQATPTTQAPTAAPAPAAPQGVRMKTPQGRVVMIPQDKVQEATARGATPA